MRRANYSSSKAAIIALTKVSARELARNQITVNAVAPGFIDVGMSKGMSDEVTQNFIKQIPLGRLGEVDEIVNAILFLASPMASYITGHVLNVNGGYYMGYTSLCDATGASCHSFQPPASCPVSTLIPSTGKIGQDAVLQSAAEERSLRYSSPT